MKKISIILFLFLYTISITACTNKEVSQAPSSPEYDIETTNGQDGYAGIFGKTIDAVEAKLVKA